MAIKLGLVRELGITIRDEDGTSERVVLKYRDPETMEWQEYQSRMAALQPDIAAALSPDGLVDTKRLSANLVLAMNECMSDFAAKLVLDAEGVEAPEGMTNAEAVRRFAPEMLLALGAHLATRMRRVDERLGKSESASEQSTAEPSAR